MQSNRILTGIKPTGVPHLGNYFGAIKPALESPINNDLFFFIADYHALTTIRDAALLKRLSFNVAATWLACGLDPKKVIFYRQSDIPEIFELSWILACLTPKGLLNRAHAYKALVDSNMSQKKDPDKNINMGLFNYPTLMAADILCFGTHLVPVGIDQKQHVEIARDIAETFNAQFGPVFVIPKCSWVENQNIVMGTDGRKMSKNYNNIVPIFSEDVALKKQVMSIKTDALSIEAVKDPDRCTLFKLYKLFASELEIASLRDQYLQGGLAYGVVKKDLVSRINDYFSPFQTQYQYYVSHPKEVDSILAEGASRARIVARGMLSRVRLAIGLPTIS
jgi:tryptophanyl-tRNA synthetase